MVSSGRLCPCAARLHSRPFRRHTDPAPSHFLQASYTGMRSCVYKQSSVIGSQAEHSGMRTYYFSADTQEDMNTWLRSMKQAALMQSQRDSVRT